MTKHWSDSILEALRNGDHSGAEMIEPLFIGQARVVDQLYPFLDSKKRMPHTLMFGEPGLGKTQLARWIAYQRGSTFTELLCPVSPQTLPNTGVVLLDECHKQTSPEPLFPLMETRTGVTFLAATTRPEKMEPAFKSRFFLQFFLEPYEPWELAELIKADLPSIQPEQAEALAKASAGNPRQAKRLIATAERIDDYDPSVVLQAARINADGLTDLHMKYLEMMVKQQRPIGISQLATMLYMPEQTVRETERLLMQLDLVELQANGRTLTRDGQGYAKALER